MSSLSAATYYVSPSGSDSNNGTSQSTPWQTIARVNQLGGSLQAGDQVLFQRGGLYRGKLTINASGNASASIVIGTYGTGARPVISGSVPVTGWTQHSGNIWRAATAQLPKQLYVDGNLMQIARFPNTGWLRVDQGTSTSLTDSELDQPNGYWTGATAVIRTTNWSYDTAYVSAFGNGVLTHSSTGNNLQSMQWGYFLRNKLELLDAPGEWYYDRAAGQLYLWCPSNANPNNALVEAAVLDNGIYVSYQRHHIRIDGVHLKHQTDAALRLSGSTQLEAMNCTISDTWQAIRSTGNDQQFHDLLIQRTYGTAVYLLDANSSFTNNTVQDVCMEAGLGENNWGYFGLRINGAGMTVSNNRFEGIGYIAIVAESNALIERNVVRNAMALLNDGGGIAFDNADGMIVRDNIVQDLVGNFESSALGWINAVPMTHGIYFGNISIKNTLVQGNTVSHCKGSGIHVDHTMVSGGNRIENNVLFDNTVQLSISDFSNYNGPGATAPFYVPAFNDTYSGNVMYCTNKDQLCMRQYHVNGANWVDWGTFSNNRYFNPYNDRSIFLHNTFNGTQRHFTLERWQAERNEDQGSTRSPLYLPSMEVTQVHGNNPVLNGTFGSNVSGWSGWPTQGQITHNTVNLDNGALKVNFTNNSTYNTFTLKHDALAPVQSGEWYRLRFSIKGDVMGEVLAGFKGQSQLTGPNMEGARYIPFDGNRRDVTLFFQSTITDQGYCSFTNSYTEGIYYIDNVELHRVTVAPVDPYARQQLFVNDQPLPMDIALDGCWSDVHGELHSGTVTLPPFTSVVLVKEDDGSCMATGTPEDEPRGDVVGFELWPNPLSSGQPLSISGTGSGTGVIKLFDMSGKLMHSARFLGDGRAHELPAALDPGTYLLRIEGDEATVQQRIMLL